MGYTSGLVRVVDVETEEVLCDRSLFNESITAISWTQVSNMGQG